ncbi:unnamed protein product [Medioppia subpectinata]|uniref:Cytochrome P450 n=1 Tax=Medioppia subpectinata TaxID=1979941 RepID=A0A7R9KUH5_9ACAR|nr:unnamed protein product [Medioppia subpectinata]CAG2110107.1 unnamed protein product [Medioppia subpectinata]
MKNVLYTKKLTKPMFSSLLAKKLTKPMFSSLLVFRNIKVHWNQHFRELYNKYGPVVTVWVGPKPVVFVGDPHVVKEAFSRPEFMGRMDTIIANIFSNADHRDLALNSHLPSWEGLRNVTHMIVRQFAKSTDFTDTVNALVSDITSQMMVKEGINQPFNPKKLRQEYWTSFKYMATFWSHDIHNNYVIYEYIPICRPFMSDPLTKLRRYYKLCFEYSLTQLKEHENTYDKSVCRDVCDMFIGARRKGEAECRPGLQWLTDKHIAATFMDLYRNSKIYLNSVPYKNVFGQEKLPQERLHCTRPNSFSIKLKDSPL